METQPTEIIAYPTPCCPGREYFHAVRPTLGPAKVALARGPGQLRVAAIATQNDRVVQHGLVTRCVDRFKLQDEGKVLNLSKLKK